MTIARFAFCAVLLVSALRGQQPAPVSVFRGEIRAPRELPQGPAVVELRLAGGPAQPERALVEPDGSFEFHNVPPGTYLVTVLTESGLSLKSEFATVAPGLLPERIDLPAARRDVPGDPVSVAALAHPPSKRDIQATQHAQKLSQAGRHAESAAELERVLGSQPEFAAARNNLGAQYMYLGRYADAREQFEAAVRIAPGARSYTNLAVALAALGELNRAEALARRALGLDHGDAKAHLTLGCILAAKPGAYEEAIRELSIAAGELASAYRELADLYARAGDSARSAQALRAYHSRTAGGGFTARAAALR